MLTGTELLAKVKDLGDVSKSDLVRRCGYVSTKKDGSERGAGKGGRKLSYSTKVQFNGNLMVGKAYTAMLDLQLGDEFEIKLGKKQICLVPLGGSDEEE